MVEWRTPFKELTIGKGRCLIEGDDIAIISIGAIGNEALKAIQKTTGRSVAFYDMRFLKPLDEELLHGIFHKFKKIITLEDGTIVGGLGSAVVEFMADHGYSAKIVRLGIPDHFVEHGANSSFITNAGMIVNRSSRQSVRYKNSNLTMKEEALLPDVSECISKFKLTFKNVIDSEIEALFVDTTINFTKKEIISITREPVSRAAIFFFQVS